MSGHRTERVSEVVREVVARLLSEGLRDPRVGFVTLTGVSVSPDLKHARIYVTRLGTEAERAASLAALNHAAPFFRRELGRGVRLRHVPDLQFVEDEAAERGFRVEDILREIHDGENEPDPKR